MSETQLATAPTTLASFEDMERAARYVAGSGMFGITKVEQAMCLFMICQAEGINYIQALRRYHLINGRPAMRADAMQGEFLARGGGIIWHVRAKDIAGATFFKQLPKGAAMDGTRKRGADRFKLLWRLDFENDVKERGKIMAELADLSIEGEETVLRTFADFEARGITEGENGMKDNWLKWPTEMLTARVATAGIRLIDPGLIAGIYSPDELEDAGLIPQGGEKRATEAPGARDRAAKEAMIAKYLEDAAEATSPERKRELQGLAAELRCSIADEDAKLNDKSNIHPVASASGVTVTANGREVEVTRGEPELIPSKDIETEIPWEDYVLKQTKIKAIKAKRLGDFSKEEIGALYGKSYMWLNSEDKDVRIEAGYIKKAYDALGGQS